MGPLIIVQVLPVMSLLSLAPPLSQLNIVILQFHDLNGEFTTTTTLSYLQY